LDKYIIDILESIVILQSKQYCHNDIKLDNTVLCNNKYKLIDWGASGPIDTIKMGTLLGTNPVKWFVYGYSKYVAETAISYRTHQRYWNFARSERFQYINDRIVEQFTALLAETTDKHALNDRFKYSYDVFMLGMSILHATYIYDIPFDKYSLLVRIFTSIRNPIKSAEIALTIAKDLLKEKTAKKSK
jgi:serine/threonine protein kinase